MFGTVTRYYEDKGYGVRDIKGIREEKNLGRKTNQQLHSLPYARIYMQLEYKLKMQGIRLIRQEESYSSQCPPQSEEVSRIYAEKKNRKKRCIYIVDTVIYNADAVGAYNILRKYHAVSGEDFILWTEETENAGKQKRFAGSVFECAAGAAGAGDPLSGQRLSAAGRGQLL